MQQRIQSSRRHAGRKRALSVGLALAATAGLLSSKAVREEDGSTPVGHARATLGELVETQRLISKERRDWKLSRELLSSQIDVVRAELESLREKIREAEQNIAEADRSRQGLIEQHDALANASDALRHTLGGLELRTRALLERLPEPLLDIVRPLSQRVPAEPETTEQPLAERFLSVVGILKFANKFQRDISVGRELRTLADGSATEVSAMYVGLGQAWYANARGSAAGLGLPGPQGWSWSAMDGAGTEIARAIALQESREPAAFVQLPVRIE
jgi:hypothetical protein